MSAVEACNYGFGINIYTYIQLANNYGVGEYDSLEGLLDWKIGGKLGNYFSKEDSRGHEIFYPTHHPGSI